MSSKSIYELSVRIWICIWSNARTNVYVLYMYMYKYVQAGWMSRTYVYVYVYIHTYIHISMHAVLYSTGSPVCCKGVIRNNMRNSPSVPLPPSAANTYVELDPPYWAHYIG